MVTEKAKPAHEGVTEVAPAGSRHSPWGQAWGEVGIIKNLET